MHASFGRAIASRAVDSGGGAPVRVRLGVNMYIHIFISIYIYMHLSVSLSLYRDIGLTAQGRGGSYVIGV